METPIEVVKRFCAAWSDDIGADDLAAFFTDDAVYHNIPLAPVTGRQSIADNIASFIALPGCDGALVGSACLDADECGAIIRTVAEERAT